MKSPSLFLIYSERTLVSQKASIATPGHSNFDSRARHLFNVENKQTQYKINLIPQSSRTQTKGYFFSNRIIFFLFNIRVNEKQKIKLKLFFSHENCM